MNSLPESESGSPPPSASEERLGTSDQAFAALREKILNGELAPGSTFSQVQLAVQLGVSRTPLREAVRRLQSEGLLRAEHNRRVRVSPLSTADFEQLYAMRIALDTLAVRISVPSLTEADLHDACEALALATASAEAGDLADYNEPHRRFHLGLSRHAGSRLLSEVEDLWDHAVRYRWLYAGHAGDRTQIVQLASREHVAILDAAAAGNAELCARRLAEHLARTALMTMVRVDQRHDPATVRAALDLVCAAAPAAEAHRRSASGDEIVISGYIRGEVAP